MKSKIILPILLIVGTAVFLSGCSGSKEMQDAFNQGKSKGRDVLKINYEQVEPSQESAKSVLTNLLNVSYGVVSENEVSEIKVSNLMVNADKPNEKMIEVRFKPISNWDEKNLMTKATGTTVEVAKRLFTNPNVGLVTVIFDGEFTDSYGKKNIGQAVRIALKRETADKIQWEQFRDMVLTDYTKLLDIADTKFVHSAISKNLK